jgi:hypothetical protein
MLTELGRRHQIRWSSCPTGVLKRVSSISSSRGAVGDIIEWRVAIRGPESGPSVPPSFEGVEAMGSIGRGIYGDTLYRWSFEGCVRTNAELYRPGTQNQFSLYVLPSVWYVLAGLE